MLSSIWLKITAALSAIIAILLTFIKFRSKKIEKLENENEFLNVKHELGEKQEIEKKEILTDEKVRIKKKLLKKSKKSRVDRLNSL